MSEDAGCAERFLCALFATVVKPICDLRLLISGSCALLFALCSVAEAQPETKIFRIGYLDATPSGSAPLMETFRQSMAKLGWIEGENIAIEYRFLDRKRDPELAEELVRAKVDVIVAAGGASPTRAAKGAPRQSRSSLQPLVILLRRGSWRALARPGGNITGLSTLGPEVGGSG